MTPESADGRLSETTQDLPTPSVNTWRQQYPDDRRGDANMQQWLRSVGAEVVADAFQDESA